MAPQVYFRVGTTSRRTNWWYPFHHALELRQSDIVAVHFPLSEAKWMKPATCSIRGGPFIIEAPIDTNTISNPDEVTIRRPPTPSFATVSICYLIPYEPTCCQLYKYNTLYSQAKAISDAGRQKGIKIYWLWLWAAEWQLRQRIYFQKCSVVYVCDGHSCAHTNSSDNARPGTVLYAVGSSEPKVFHR